MTTLKQRMQAECAFGLSPADMRTLLADHVIDNPLVYAVQTAKHALDLSKLDHMTMLAFHAVMALEETQAAHISYVNRLPMTLTRDDVNRINRQHVDELLKS